MRSPKPPIVSIPPTTPVLTLAEVRDGYLKAVDDADENAFITALIEAATEKAESYMGRKIMTQMIAEFWDTVPTSGVFELSYSNVSSIISVVYNDRDGNAQVLAAGDRYDDLYAFWPKVSAKETFPDVFAVGYNNITVTYEAGQATAADVPEQIKQAIKLMVGRWYECREDYTRQPLPLASELLLSIYRLRLNI